MKVFCGFVACPLTNKSLLSRILIKVLFNYQRERVHTVVMRLDHVRAKKSYVRTVTKWVQQLALRGAFIFQQKLILIVLQGPVEDIKEYLSRHRTQCVDVDSAGRKCKERMLTVLGEFESSPIKDTFIVKDLNSVDELRTFFDEIGLSELYSSHVQKLVK